MSRVTRKVATATIVVNGRSDTDDFHSGVTYQGGYTDDQLATILENMLTEVITGLFPRPCGKAHAELVSVAVVVV